MHPSDWFLLWNVCQWLTDLPSGSLLSLLCPVLWIKWSGSRFVRGVLSEGGSSGGVAMTADEGGPGWRSPSVLLYPSSGLSVHRAHWGLCRPPESPCINSVAGCPGFSSSAILHLLGVCSGDCRVLKRNRSLYTLSPWTSILSLPAAVRMSDPLCQWEAVFNLLSHIPSCRLWLWLHRWLGYISFVVYGVSSQNWGELGTGWT